MKFAPGFFLQISVVLIGRLGLLGFFRFVLISKTAQKRRSKFNCSNLLWISSKLVGPFRFVFQTMV